MIFEHLGGNTEETEWVNYRLGEGKGILVWGNHNSAYNEATMGYNANSNFSWISYKNRGWSVPGNVSYMESHDEERLMYKNLQFGNSSGTYNIKTLATALDRMELAGAFYFTVPGPKMIWQFGELGYDFSIDYDCRVCNKPIRWDYVNDLNRKDLYNMWSKLIKLKKQENIFRTANFSLDVANTNGLKSIHLTDDAVSTSELKYITIIGNFGVTTQSINPAFQTTGTWYDLLNDNTSISYTTSISLQPGEFKIYGNQSVVLGLESVNNVIEDVVLYPNPTNSSFRISKQVTNLTIYDVTGKKVKSFIDGFSENYSFDISDLTPAFYFIKIQTEKGLVVKQLVKQ